MHTFIQHIEKKVQSKNHKIGVQSNFMHAYIHSMAYDKHTHTYHPSTKRAPHVNNKLALFHKSLMTHTDREDIWFAFHCIST